MHVGGYPMLPAGTSQLAYTAEGSTTGITATASTCATATEAGACMTELSLLCIHNHERTCNFIGFAFAGSTLHHLVPA